MSERKASAVRCAIAGAALAVLSTAIAARAEAPPATLAPGSDVNRWLSEHPSVQAAVRWEAPDGTVRGHAEWEPALRDQLQTVFGVIARGESPLLPAVPPLAPSRDADMPFPLNPELARWPPGTARDYFVAFVAQSLAVEIGRWVPWSISGYAPAELAPLLDSRSLFVAEPATQTYRIPFTLGAITPGDPVRLHRFLQANGLIGPTPRDTIERVVGWTGRNVVHFTGDWDAANVFAQWQYYGWPPVERILAGTVNEKQRGMGVQRRSGACFGTVGLLHTLLRTVNVPVEVLNPCLGHGIPHFVREDLYLSHGDDPYDVFMIATPPIPFGELLIDRAQYEEWMGGGGDEVSITVCKHVGRQVRDLAIRHLSNQLLRLRCTDRGAGTAPADSQVYDVFRFDYSVEQLRKQRLWERLDEKIAALGGCDKVPPARWTP
jgi:hypothetical protein